MTSITGSADGYLNISKILNTTALNNAPLPLGSLAKVG